MYLNKCYQRSVEIGHLDLNKNIKCLRLTLSYPRMGNIVTLILLASSHRYIKRSFFRFFF